LAGVCLGGGGEYGLILSGNRFSPLNEISIELTASSSKSISNMPFSFLVWGPILSKNFATLFPNYSVFDGE
jgi:hypothetical protein